ncbi:MAG: hypothetical protein WA399_10860 [Acidobacteriaceae bacterium]
MSKSTVIAPSGEFMVLLSQLLLPQQGRVASQHRALVATLSGTSRERFDELVALASSNHVIIRAMDLIVAMMREAGDEERASWAEEAQAAEGARIENALSFLKRICTAFEQEGLDVTVIKSLDHWPDLGSDLDLYTNADPVKVGELMGRRFYAQLAARSWGDRLARKWNFEIPGLPEAVEIHMGRLGQTGEQAAMAASIYPRSRQAEVGGKTFRLTAISDRIMISTLQRMYRHFYFRLCDILDSGGLVENGLVDYDDLQRAAQRSDIWEGVATYLVIVSDYVQQYRGTGLDLPRAVRSAARFGGNLVYYSKEFLRVPIFPQSATLYRQQLGGMLRKRELHSSARLGLLPPLATAALVGMKLTGSDKGIW